MARKKSSGPGSLIAAVVVGGLVLLAAVPKELWIAAGVGAIAWFAFYLYRKSKTSTSAQVEPTPMQSMDRTETQDRGTAWPKRGGSVLGTSPSPSPAIEPVGPPTKAMPAEVVEFRIPPAPTGYGEGRWVPAGQAVDVGNVRIPGGLVYIGTALKTASGANDPCLIDPSKSVGSKGDYTERQFGYWPSYAEIPPSARRAYLNWLTDGRRAPEADIGFVFLFFYGLERRAILDASKDPSARADWPNIALELRRLLSIYGEKSGSFRRYAGELLDWVSLADHPSKLYDKPVPDFPRTNELPLYLRLALGQAAVDGVPVPARLALAWVRLEPNVYLRTPAQRCPEQFEALFHLKYRENFGAGVELPKNRTKLKFVYQPASSGLHGYKELALHFGETPDVTVLTAPVKRLLEFVDTVQTELEPYSRFVGRQPQARSSLEGLLQLPAPLWPEGARRELEALKSRMGEGMVMLKFQELLAKLGATSTFTKEKTIALARALESANVGMEPDVLAGARAPKPEERVVLFASPAGEPTSRLTSAYRAALLTLQLSSAVASADSEFSAAEMSHLRSQIQSWTHLTPNHLRRLLAQLRLLMAMPVTVTSLKKKLEPLDAAVKEAIARLMATLVQADGTVSPTEVKMLEKAYTALGIDSKRVFTDVHAVANGTKVSPAVSTKVEQTGFKLDPARIAALQKDTDKVSALLANIFVEEAETAAPAPEVEVEVEADTGLMGLDGPHTAFARMLLSRPSWTRAELDDVSSDLELMLDGALERVNEASFDAYGVPLIEGDDPVEVNTEVLEKIEA
ncbi:MAG: TerB N-terminal domain-containing protein [Rubrivivax sp.]|nr:TerB N-terminal domain-containing protein [Rubrivivax sp.]